MKKFKLQKGIIAGALAISMVFSGCSKTNEKDNISSTIYDDLSSSSENNNSEEINSDVTINLDKVPDSLTTEIEEVELENGEIGWKLPYNYVPYNVIEGKGLGFYAIVEKNLENDYIIIQPPMSLQDGEYVMPSLEGEIGVHMAFIKALSLKTTIINKYGKSMENTLVDYSFATPEEQEELAKIDALEEKVIEAYNINSGVSLRK